MQGEGSLHADSRTLDDHRLGARGHDLLSRLEEKSNPAWQLRGHLVEHQRQGRSHGSVNIMATGVTHAWTLRHVFDTRRLDFVDRQGVDVPTIDDAVFTLAHVKTQTSVRAGERL